MAGDCRAHTPTIPGRTAGPTGIAVPRAAAAGASRLDQREVGNLGSKTAREVLPADPGGTPAARQRDGAVGATGGRGDAGRAHELAMRILSILRKRARALCRGGAMDRELAD